MGDVKCVYWSMAWTKRRTKRTPQNTTELSQPEKHTHVKKSTRDVSLCQMLGRRVFTSSLHGLSVITANFSKLELRNKAKMLPIFLLFASSGEVQSFFHASSGHEPNKPGTGEAPQLPSSTDSGSDSDSGSCWKMDHPLSPRNPRTFARLCWICSGNPRCHWPGLEMSTYGFPIWQGILHAFTWASGENILQSSSHIWSSTDVCASTSCKSICVPFCLFLSVKCRRSVPPTTPRGF